MFVLTRAEFDSLRSQILALKKDNLRSQIVTSSYGGARYLPFAFSEHGVAMLASVLNNDKAIEVNIAIVRAFIAMREIALNVKEFSAKIVKLEKKYNKQFSDVYEVINILLEERKAEKAQKTRVRIGFKR